MDIVKKLVEIPKGESEDLAKALAIAKEQEENARDFYRKVGQRARDEELKKAMEFLVKEEQSHFDALNAVEEALKKDGKFAVVGGSALKRFEKPKIYPEKGAEVKRFQDKNELTALLWAMRAERKAELFYRKRAEKASAPDVKRFFETLAEFEVGHYQFLDGIFSTWTATDDFILG